MAKTYSFKSLSGAFTHPLVGSFVFAGKLGIGQITIGMAGEKTAHDRASDGAIMVSFISGDDGYATIEIQQTSLLHQFLVSWYNVIKTSADLGDPTNWATAALTMRSIVDGAEHELRGISPEKMADKGYAAQGGKVTWKLMAASVQTF
jgi:hypothetical protein